MSIDREQYDWWTSLKHGGLLIAPGKLDQYFPAAAEPLPRRHAEQLRRDLTRFVPGDSQSLSYLLDTVLQEVLGLDRRLWFKANQLGTEWSHKAITGETIRPRRVWVDAHEHAFPVFVEKDVARIGIGRGRRTVSRVIEWLRRADQKVALLTNGRQWRLIHAGADYAAWAESDTDQWFVEGQPGPQVDAFRLLLNPHTLSTEAADATPLLWTAIQASRQGQAELSAELGERVRRAVELLIRESAVSVDRVRSQANFTNNDLYIAANRIIMRCVIILFAEARDLLPRDNVIYHDSYGLQGLREQLDRLAGGRAQERLRHSYSAWPRLLALFRLMYHGSPHESLPIPAYSGQLFAPGDLAARDPITRALVAFEQINPCPSDAAIYRILEFLTKSKIKVRQGNRSTWVDAPVDFSDLSTEYIGILYQGLLDFELRQADPDEPMIFLNLGDQPVLPLSRLENMDDAALSALVEKLKTASKPTATDDDEEAGEDDASSEEEVEELDADDEVEEDAVEDEDPETDEEVDDIDTVRQLRERAEAWAAQAVKAGGLVSKPRGRSSAALAAYEADVAAFAPRLIARIVLPGEWFLVRWGGTRKGSGTFYTRPQLGVPLVRRTLQPLAYEQQNGAWVPRLPEQILDLKVCDSAMGSASLLVATLRYLTTALYESLFYHDRISAHGEQGICRLADGQLTNELLTESLPVPPDHPEFEDRLQARLKRYVVERCIYGVDLNPLAVELARLSLWIETMDPRLPFSFIDHKLKVGNALVGCWLDRFQDYPVMAWEREGGDKNHDRFVHHYREFTTTRGKNKGKIEQRGDKWTQAIKDKRNETIKPEMTVWIQQLGTRMMTFGDAKASATDLHATTLKAFEKMHQLALTDPAQQAAVYHEQILENPAYKQLKLAFDTWCAIWFWPGDELDNAPTPLNFQELPPDTTKIVQQVTEMQRFFHWELEFPDVYNPQRNGFDAMIGNPPWENLQPNPEEFFSNEDTLFRTYGRLEKREWMFANFRQEYELELRFISYQADFKSISNWVKYSSDPFSHEKNISGIQKPLLRMWRSFLSQRRGFAMKSHPFKLQVGRLFTYKLFIEQSLYLLNSKGRLGIIVPSGLYTDAWSAPIRNHLLSKCDWELIFSFINWNKIFQAIYYRFKFCVAIIQKGSSTSKISVSFNRYHLEDWESAKGVFPYSIAQVAEFSPRMNSLIEARNAKTLEILEKMYEHGVLLGDTTDKGWNIEYALEFMMNTDASKFPPKLNWEKQDYFTDEYGFLLQGHWKEIETSSTETASKKHRILSKDSQMFVSIEQVESFAMPLFEGRMIGQFDSSQKGWVSGKGRTATWRDIPFDEKQVEAQFYMGHEVYKSALGKSDKLNAGLKIGFMDVASSTNSRTMIATLIASNPCGNKVPTLRVNFKKSHNSEALLCAILNSLAYDFQLRSRYGGLSLNYYILDETSLLEPNRIPNVIADWLVITTFRLIGTDLSFAPHWWLFHKQAHNHIWYKLWAITLHERLRLRCMIDAIVAHLYGLNVNEFSWILTNCVQPLNVINDRSFYRTLDPKGFWRVDKDKDPELRHTVLSLIAFHDLKEKGLDAFLAQNNGEGWLLPETLRLADYGLGHDDRAKEHQPVANRLGPRFLPWQLQGTPAQSWAECERHAQNLRLLLGDLVEEPDQEKKKEAESGPDYSPTKNLLGEPIQRDLFGNIVEPKKRRK